MSLVPRALALEVREMNKACQLCRGACCESMVLPTSGLAPDQAVWLALHGRMVGKGMVEVEQPCSQLQAGLCAAWSHRPNMCRDYAVGGGSCRATVLRRRPADAQAILAAMPPL